MKTTKFTYWKGGGYLGFLNDYPGYRTQGLSREELVKNLKDLLADLESGEIPCARNAGRGEKTNDCGESAFFAGFWYSLLFKRA